MRDRVVSALAWLALVAPGGCSSASSSGAPSAPTSDGGVAPLAQIAIVEIDAFQATKAQIITTTPVGPVGAPPVPLGHPASPNAPVVALRPGLVRVYVDPTNGGTTAWTPHPLTAELDVFDSNGDPLGATNGGGQAVHVATQTVQARSTDGDMASTFNFSMAAQDLPAGAKFALTIRDPSAAPGSDAKGGAQWPSSGGGAMDDMGVQSSGAAGIALAIVPLEYQVDGSGRVPDTSATTLDPIALALMNLYPVSQVTYTVHAAIPWTTPTLDGSGNGWDAVLTQIDALRQSEGAPANVWYVAYVDPSDSFDDYCIDGCVLGLQPTGSNATDHVVAAIGYDGMAATILPELIARTLGEERCTCGLGAGADPNWPSGEGTTSASDTMKALEFPTYVDGGIGQFGYDVTTRALYDPTSTSPRYVDFMASCNAMSGTLWTSDYTYKNIFSAIQKVNGVASN